MTAFKYLLIPSLALFIFGGCKSEERQKSVPSTQEKMATVLVAHPQNHSFNTLLAISGVTKPNQQVKIFAMSNGYLKEIRADIGDAVANAQIVALLDNPELFSQKSKLQAELKGKQALYERLKSIYAKTPQLTTVIDVENAEAEYESLKAQLKSIEVQLGYLAVRAPFSGVITNRFVDKGAILQNGLNSANATPIFEVQDINPIRLSVEIPETDVALITKGSRAMVEFPELPDQKIKTTVSRTGFSLNPATRTMEIQFDIPNPNRKIRPGMYAKVSFERGGFKETLSLVNEAIGNLKGESYVYVITQGIAHKIPVKTGTHDEKFTEILNGAVSANDEIVVQGKELCADGTSVKTKLIDK